MYTGIRREPQTISIGKLKLTRLTPPLVGAVHAALTALRSKRCRSFAENPLSCSTTWAALNATITVNQEGTTPIHSKAFPHALDLDFKLRSVCRKARTVDNHISFLQYRRIKTHPLQGHVPHTHALMQKKRDVRRVPFCMCSTRESEFACLNATGSISSTVISPVVASFQPRPSCLGAPASASLGCSCGPGRSRCPP